MNIKILLTLSLAFLFACGGGSSGTAVASNPAAAAGGTNSGNITDQLQIVE